jgi:hypothetical protein
LKLLAILGRTTPESMAIPALQEVPAARGRTIVQDPLAHCWNDVPSTQLNWPSGVHAVPKAMPPLAGDAVLAGVSEVAFSGSGSFVGFKGGATVGIGGGTTTGAVVGSVGGLAGTLATTGGGVQLAGGGDKTG